MTRRGKNPQRDKRALNFGGLVVVLVALVAGWLYVDRPVTTDVVKAVVTQGVWKSQRYRGATYEGVASLRDGTVVSFTAYRPIPLGAQIEFYRYRRPLSGFTTYEYAGPF